MNGIKVVVASLTVGLFAVLIYLFSAFGQFQTSNNEYIGYINIGFEMNSFHLCNGEGEWNLSGMKRNDVRELYHALKSDSNIPIYAVLNGTVSDSGSYGHMGFYKREIQVSNIVSISTTRPPQCSAS
tara:strand:+ start:61 stop:441 length:381 start_codon:yes stop_codon:yes gene_type:complete